MTVPITRAAKGSALTFSELDASLAPAANSIYVKAHFGAVGDGVTDDTAAINAALAAITANRGKTLVFEPGVYLVPNGITNTKGGLRIEGMGTYGAGPGGIISGMGVHLKATATGVWTWTQGADASANSMLGCHFKGICFSGDADTAGGLLLYTGHNLVENCAAYLHTASGAVGFRTVAPSSPGDSAPLNKFLVCTACDCMIGFQAGPGNAQYTHFIDCFAQKFSSGGIINQGAGIRIYDSGSCVIGGHFENNDIAIDCLQEFGCRILSPFFEANATCDVYLHRASGTSSTRNTVIVSGEALVKVGAYQYDDLIVGGWLDDSGNGTKHLGGNA